jgi:hypothetical protein
MHPVLYEGDLGELLVKYYGKYAGRDQECPALPQSVTNVGYRGNWHRGARVVDQTFIAPGTVIANFKLVNGKYIFPSEHGYHVALFSDFGNRKPSGGYTHFYVVDQWHGKTVARRNKNSFPPEVMKARGYLPCDNADDYYIVLVP